MKTLFNICLSFISKNMQILGDDLNCLPDQCKSLLFEWFVSHDYLNSSKIRSIMTEGKFVGNLKQLTFYLSDQITDDFLKALSTKVNRNLSLISIIYCDKVGDRGVRAITEFQTQLVKLELKGLNSVTSFGIAGVVSDHLNVVDFSDCPNICSSGIIHMVNHNPNIQNMFLNNCKAIDDLGLYAIGAHLGKNLKSLELDFLADHLRDPQAAIAYLTERCPNIMQMSLCRYFSPFSASSHFFDLECTINSNELRELDLHGNFFTVLPRLPKNISSLRLSCTGNENVHDLVQRLKDMPHLNEVRLAVTNFEYSNNHQRPTNNNEVENFLKLFLPACGSKITGLQLAADHLTDETLRLVVNHCHRLVALSLSIDQSPSTSASYASLSTLRALFANPKRSEALRSLKISGARLAHKMLANIARLCRNLEEAEFSFMDCVDDRFLRLLASHCRRLSCLNLNGCPWVTDKGVCALARSCPLRELRLRSTAVTDKCVYVLAQCCPQLEWIAHADYSGRPKFSQTALQALKDNCCQRVIC